MYSQGCTTLCRANRERRSPGTRGACLPSPMWARPEAGRVRREAGCAKPWHSVRAVLCRAVLWVLSCAAGAELCCRGPVPQHGRAVPGALLAPVGPGDPGKAAGRSPRWAQGRGAEAALSCTVGGCGEQVGARQQWGTAQSCWLSLPCCTAGQRYNLTTISLAVVDPSWRRPALLVCFSVPR